MGEIISLVIRKKNATAQLKIPTIRFHKSRDHIVMNCSKEKREVGKTFPVLGRNLEKEEFLLKSKIRGYVVKLSVIFTVYFINKLNLFY